MEARVSSWWGSGRARRPVGPARAGSENRCGRLHADHGPGGLHRIAALGEMIGIGRQIPSAPVEVLRVTAGRWPSAANRSGRRCAGDPSQAATPSSAPASESAAARRSRPGPSAATAAPPPSASSPSGTVTRTGMGRPSIRAASRSRGDEPGRQGERPVRSCRSCPLNLAPRGRPDALRCQQPARDRAIGGGRHGRAR